MVHDIFIEYLIIYPAISSSSKASRPNHLKFNLPYSATREVQREWKERETKREREKYKFNGIRGAEVSISRITILFWSKQTKFATGWQPDEYILSFRSPFFASYSCFFS